MVRGFSTSFQPQRPADQTVGDKMKRVSVPDGFFAIPPLKESCGVWSCLSRLKGLATRGAFQGARKSHTGTCESGQERVQVWTETESFRCGLPQRRECANSREERNSPRSVPAMEGGDQRI